MAKNYAGQTFTASYTDSHSSFEKSYTFDQTYHRILNISTTQRPIVRGATDMSESGLLTFENTLEIDASKITYIRIRVLNDATVKLLFWNNQITDGKFSSIECDINKPFISYGNFKIAEDILAHNDIDHISLRGSGSSTVEIFIGMTD